MVNFLLAAKQLPRTSYTGNRFLKIHVSQVSGYTMRVHGHALTQYRSLGRISQNPCLKGSEISQTYPGRPLVSG